MIFSLRHTLPKLISYFCMAVLFVFLASVFLSATLRYGFNVGSVKLEDVIGYTFASLVIISVFVSFLKDAHVRVKLFSVIQTPSTKTIADIISALPFFVIAFLSLPAIYFSWSIFEGSREPNGLGGLFFIKTLLPVSFVAISVFLCFRRKDHNK